MAAAVPRLAPVPTVRLLVARATPGPARFAGRRVAAGPITVAAPRLAPRPAAGLLVARAIPGSAWIVGGSVAVGAAGIAVTAAVCRAVRCSPGTPVAVVTVFGVAAVIRISGGSWRVGAAAGIARCPAATAWAGVPAVVSCAGRISFGAARTRISTACRAACRSAAVGAARPRRASAEASICRSASCIRSAVVPGATGVALCAAGAGAALARAVALPRLGVTVGAWVSASARCPAAVGSSGTSRSAGAVAVCGSAAVPAAFVRGAVAS
jgi:hypothetical protein